MLIIPTNGAYEASEPDGSGNSIAFFSLHSTNCWKLSVRKIANKKKPTLLLFEKAGNVGQTANGVGVVDDCKLDIRILFGFQSRGIAHR